MTVELQSDPSLFTKPVPVTASSGEKVAIGPTEVKKLRVPLKPEGEKCVVTFTVSPTLVPNQVTHGANPDPRELGTHFSRFTYAP